MIVRLRLIIIENGQALMIEGLYYDPFFHYLFSRRKICFPLYFPAYFNIIV
jgi:hypothetical protein